MSLILEIEYLTGVVFAALGPDSDQPDWPPQPDRVFSALVASWAARGRKAEEAQALEWLEAQATPDILASGMTPRLVALSFVPPNDPSTGRNGDLSVLPAHRHRQPRRFPAARPTEALVRLWWARATPEDGMFDALGGLARDTSYLGHSASLTRLRFLRAEVPRGAPPPQPARLRVYPGRFAELRVAYHAGRRPRPGDPVAVRGPGGAAPTAGSIFDGEWLRLEHLDRQVPSRPGMPDVRASAVVATLIRERLSEGYRRIGRPVPEVISGRKSDGGPSTHPHLAIAPLAFVGFAHADGRVLGFALIPPRGSGLLDDIDFLRALRAVSVWDPQASRHVLRLDTAAAGPARGMELAITAEAERRSLHAQPYIGPALTFATVTPIVLNRHPKRVGEGGEAELRDQIVQAYRHIGLPEPAAASVVPSLYSAVTGGVSALSRAPVPGWTAWRLPAHLVGRPRTHAVIRFCEPVEGPVLLGAGRYLGLGLCRALDDGGNRR